MLSKRKMATYKCTCSKSVKPTKAILCKATECNQRLDAKAEADGKGRDEALWSYTYSGFVVEKVSRGPESYASRL